MKIKTLVRNPDDYLRETKHDIHKIHRNYDPSLHPFEVAREYTRALNAVKLERVFAKPFICSLDGHRDGVSVLAKHPERISWLFSGSCDGELKIWDLPSRKNLKSFQAHDGYIRGITFTVDSSALYTIGDDKTVRRWKCGTPLAENMEEAVSTNISKSMLMSITHHWRDPVYATSGEMCQIWEETRAQPIRSFTWGVDSLHHVRFNPIETNILSACASDRSVILYDMRERKPLRKVVMKLKCNALAWNPMEAYTFTVANEDYYLYSFDMRNLNAPMNVHMDHTSAVTDVDYSPTGKEFVSGSYDKTVRIFEADKGHSRDIYHTKRMQRLTCVLWSNDDKYIMSGSDEMNIRLWKARASEKLGVVKERERAALDSAARLKEKFAAHPHIKRIARHRQIPKHVLNARNEMRVMLQSRSRKEANRRAHSKPGSVPFVPERKKHIVREEE